MIKLGGFEIDIFFHGLFRLGLFVRVPYVGEAWLSYEGCSFDRWSSIPGIGAPARQPL